MRSLDISGTFILVLNNYQNKLEIFSLAILSILQFEWKRAVLEGPPPLLAPTHTKMDVVVRPVDTVEALVSSYSKSLNIITPNFVICLCHCVYLLANF